MSWVITIIVLILAILSYAGMGIRLQKLQDRVQRLEEINDRRK